MKNGIIAGLLMCASIVAPTAARQRHASYTITACADLHAHPVGKSCECDTGFVKKDGVCKKVEKRQGRR
jgi:hypothetical protein